MQQQHEILSNAREKDPQRSHLKEVHRTNPKSFGLFKAPLQQHSTAEKQSAKSRAELRVEVTKLFDPKRMAPGN
jgi:hypothetical protein